MLRDEYNRLMSLFAESAEGKKVNLDEVFHESIGFFEHLTLQLKTGSLDEKTDALMMMSELYTQMQLQTKKICESTGLSEEQLAAYTENPNNFSPSQWELMKDARTKMTDAGKDLGRVMIGLTPQDQRPKIPSTPPEGRKKTSGKRRGLKKDQWMRS